jgi:catechol 2,3-dioxygenase-like lactoylglutathione lyase family enzyme
LSVGSHFKAINFVYTRDPKASAAFYRDVIGLSFVGEDPFAIVMEQNGAGLRIVEIPNHVAGDHPVLGWQVEDIKASIASLVGHGVKMKIYDGFGQDDNGIWSAPDGRAKIVWFEDLDGNLLSLTEVA